MGFESFLGNPKAVSVVRDMLASGRLPGALLFAGPDGVGKKTLALMLAKALNCERRAPGQDDFCGDCRSCQNADEMLAATREDLARRREMKDATRRVEGLVYFDIQLIEPITRFILIEQIRQLRNVAYSRPFQFPRRVFILDEAQAIHWQAIDLLLKVLEEPPDSTTFILVCSNAYVLRPTVRSRCLRIQFQPVPDAVIEKLLSAERRLTKTQQTVAIRAAGGSVAKAKTFDLADFERRRRPWLDFLDSVAGSPGAVPDWGVLTDSTRALTESREGFEAGLKIGYDLLRDLLLIREGGADADLLNLDLIARLKAWARRMGLAGIEKLKTGLDQAYRLQTRNVNQQLGLETLAIDFVAGLQSGCDNRVSGAVAGLYERGIDS